MKHTPFLIAVLLAAAFFSVRPQAASGLPEFIPMEREKSLDSIPLGAGGSVRLTPEEGRVDITKEGMTAEDLMRKKDPLVIITAPRDSIVTRAYQVVSGKVGGDIEKAFLRVNEDTQMVTVAGGVFEARCALKPGLNSITVLAWDLEGSIGKDSLKVFYKPSSSGPPVKISSHKDWGSLDITDGRVITVEATTKDLAATGGVLVINNIPWRVVFKNGMMRQDIALLPGMNEMYVEMEGGGGGIATSDKVRLNTFDARPKDLVAVLTWDSRTADMDLHVWDSFGHHTFTEAKDPYQCDAAIPGGMLDMDRRGDYGPEVFSLEAAEPEVYRFYVKYNPGVKKEVAKATLSLLLHGDEPSRRITRCFGPFVTGGDRVAWEAAHVKMPEGIFFQEKGIDLVKTLSMDSKAVKRLALMLEEENPAFRLLAISAMGQIKSEEAVGPLLKALTDASPEIRRAAAGALWSIKSVKSTEALMGSLADPDPEVRRASAGALGSIGDTKALYALNGLLADEADTLVRVEAIRALGMMGDARAFAGLISQARDQDVRIRAEAARAMGNLKSEKAEGILKEVLGDKAAGVREVAAWSLGRLGLKTSVKPLLDALYFDESEGVRVQASIALGRIKDMSTMEDLRKAAEKDSSESVRFCAAKALEGMTAPKEYTRELPPVVLDDDVVVY